MRVLSLPQMMLSSSLKAVRTRGSELVILAGSVVFSNIEIQPARAISQLLTKKVNASTLTSLDAMSLTGDTFPIFGPARSRLPDRLRLDAAAALLQERLRLLVFPAPLDPLRDAFDPAWARCRVPATAGSRELTSLESAPVPMSPSRTIASHMTSISCSV